MKSLEPIPLIELWLFSARNAFRHRKRSSVCMLTIAAGVMSLLLFEAFNKGALWSYQERVVHARWGHFQIEKVLANGTFSTDLDQTLFELPEDLESKLQKLEVVDNVFPRIKLSGLLTTESRSVPVLVEGIDPERENNYFLALEYSSGRAMNPSQTDEVLLGKNLAQGLGVKEGDRVTLLSNTVDGSLNAIDLVVAGTISAGVKDFDETFLRIHHKAAQDLLRTEKISSLVIGLKDSEDIGPARSEIKALLPQGFVEHRFDELDSLNYGNAVRWLNSQFLFIRLIILSIVILGILNTVNITIFERTSEIGTLRAMGFSKAFIRNSFLREYALLGLGGAFLGVILAFVFSKFILFNGVPMPPHPGATKGLSVILELRPISIALNAGLAVLCAVVATFWPAHRSSKISIVEALGHRL